MSGQISPPLLNSASPDIVGIGGKIRLTGVSLGAPDNSVVVFPGEIIATQVERHSNNEIVVRVPLGAESGAVRVVRGVNAGRLRQVQQELTIIEDADSAPILYRRASLLFERRSELRRGVASSGVPVVITCAYVSAPKAQAFVHGKAPFALIKDRLVVDLKDFYGFPTAISLADQVKAEVVGYLPVTNSFVLDFPHRPMSLPALQNVRAQLQRDPRVAEVWLDLGLSLKQVAFADVDVLNRYRHRYNANMLGREDVWATDRIQAPSAWNLIERFHPGGRGGLNAVKIAVLDTGCDQTHPEFNGVNLVKVNFTEIRLKIAGREVILPGPANFTEVPYTNGDDASQHGSRVVSLIGARNGNVLDAGENDRGINGMLHNPTTYTIQIYQGSRFNEEYDPSFNFTLTDFLATINASAITGARVINASWGQSYPINPNTSPHRAEVRVALRKLAHQLNQFQTRVLLCVAAGNEAVTPDPENMRGLITPFEDFDLDGVLDPGEDQNGNGVLDHGNYIAASLGTLPNVLTVGATGGDGQIPSRNNAHDDQRAGFSNWGVPVKIAAPGTEVFTAGGSAGTFTIGGARFRRSSGTSFATPLTTGSAGLLRAIDGTLTPAQIRNLLLSTTFQVNTIDGNGNLLVWETLKVGFAVRQLLLNNGVIGNNQEWTGVSKVILDGVSLFEIRRGANGRAEGFAERALPVTGFSPAIRHDGRLVAYYTTEAGGSQFIKAYNFTTATESTLDGPYDPPLGLGPVLEFNPRGILLWSIHMADECVHRWWVYARQESGMNDLVADTDTYNGCPFDKFGNPLEWKFYWVYRGSMRPDNRAWDLDYHYRDGNGGNINQDCRNWWHDNLYPQATLMFPQCLGEVYWLPCWAPEGRARGGLLPPAPGALPPVGTRYYDVNHALQVNRTRVEPGADTIRWLNWSPEGSELGYTATVNGALTFVTLRRDIRNVNDRSPHNAHVIAGGGGSFTWGW